VRSLRKIPLWLRGTSFRINYTNSPCFASSFMQLWNDLKCTQILCNAPKYEFTIQCGGLGAFVAKNPGSTSWQVFFALIAPVHTTMHRVSCSYETIPNAPKHNATHQNMSLWSNGVDWVRSLWKIRTWIRGTNFCNNCTSSHRFAPSFMQLRNHNKCTQTQWSLWKHKFRVQWGGLGGFIAKNSDMTSWHELLH